MKVKMKVEKNFDIKYLKVHAHVRYWEDSDVNGEGDIDIDENPDECPRMPFAVESDGEWWWDILIDVEKGTVVGWPKGTTAGVHYKVCDEGTYTLKDPDMENVVEVNSYVPSCLAPLDSGYGDYIIMDIDANGKIDGFEFGQEDVDDIIGGQF